MLDIEEKNLAAIEDRLAKANRAKRGKQSTMRVRGKNIFQLQDIIIIHSQKARGWPCSEIST